MIRKFLLVVVILASCVLQGITEDSLSVELEQILEDKKPSGSQWSILISRKSDNKTIFSKYPDQKLIPASNMKVPICSAALLRLGATYTYQTRLYLNGNQEGSTFRGDIIVVGSGDPSIGGRFNSGDLTFLFRQWAALIKRQNIRTVTGNVIGVDDFFDNQQYGLNWHPEDYVEWYAAEISALTFNDGCIDLTIRGSSRVGRPASIQLEPQTDYITIANQVKTVSSRRRERKITFHREPESRKMRISGALRTRYTWKGWATVANPTLYFVSVFKEVLEKEGIRIQGHPKDVDDVRFLPDQKSWKLLDTYESPPLSRLIEVCLKNSQNLYAEHFLKTLGAVDYGIGSLETGAAAVKDILYQQGGNIDEQYIADGSGLSRENRISARALVRILQTIDSTVYRKSFREALPLAGVDGTLERRMRATAAYHRVRAKTGTLSGVRALSGYIKAQSGETYIFSMLANGPRSDYRFTRVMDSLCELIAKTG